MSHIVERYGIQVDLSKEGHTTCPKCRVKLSRDKGGDNLMVYGLDSSGNHKGAYCWSCEFTIPSEEWLEENGEESKEQEIVIVGKQFNDEIHDQIKSITGIKGKGYRGIPEEVNKEMLIRYEYSEDTGEPTIQYYPCTVADDSERGFSISGYKRRQIPKTFINPYGETGKECQMFMQWKFHKAKGKYCLIVGGEIDALSAYTMLKEYTDSKGNDPIPVVSPTIGESGCHKQVALNYQWFDRFDRIIVAMDSDAAGQEATAKICAALPKGKAFCAELSMKDPNEYLMAGKAAEFRKHFYAAAPFTPDGIVGSGKSLQGMRESVLVPKIPLPPFMHNLQKMMAGGIPLGRIVNIAAASGIGKSSFVDELVYFLAFHSPYRMGVVSLESDVDEYRIKMLSRHIGIKIDLIEDPEEKYQLLSRPDIMEKSNELFLTGDSDEHRWHLMDERDGGLENLKSKMMELIIGCECKVIVIDPVSDCLDGLSNDEQAVFMKWLKGMTKSHKVTFILVHHTRKSSSDQKAGSTGGEIHEESIIGSGSSYKSAAANILLSRNKEHPGAITRNVMKAKLSKCRWTGRTSPTAGLYYYDNETHTLYDLEEFFEKNPDIRELYEEEQMAMED